MLKLTGKRLLGKIDAPLNDRIEISYTTNDKEYYLIAGGKPYPLIKYDNLLIWEIPSHIDKNNLSIQVQAIDPKKRNTLYVTPEISVSTVSTVSSRNDGFLGIATTKTSTYTYDSDYPFYDMVDDHGAININNRKIEMPNDYQVVVSGDNVSQLLTFNMNRYFDGTDLSQKSCGISYKNANKEGGKAIAVNVRTTDDKLIVGWLLDNNVTAKSGIVEFKIEFIGYNEFEQMYVWQTVPAKLKVEEGLWIDDIEVVERYPSIIEDIQIQLKILESLVSGEQGEVDDSIIARITQIETNISNMQNEIEGLRGNVIEIKESVSEIDSTIEEKIVEIFNDSVIGFGGF